MGEPFVFLDDSRPGRENSRLYTGLAGAVIAYEAAEIGPALEMLAAAQAGGLFAAGYFAYELCYGLEPKLGGFRRATTGVPLLWFGLFRNEETFSKGEATAWLAAQSRGRAYAGPLRLSETEDGYAQRFAGVRDYILAGDAYQVNLTFPARFAFAGDPLALYARLRPRAGAGHGAFVDDGGRHILSLSPELFFSVQNGIITARPMKGTAPRGASDTEDARIATHLKASEKDRAENLMIVDLIRNDIGRVAEIGTVRVEDLFAIETYPTVHQMVSTVCGELRQGVTPGDLVRALFPCGSVTGAPKLRAIEIIRELEPEPRGLYCGAIGVFAPNGGCDFNVAIRTLTIEGDEGKLGIGGGIVADSKADAEYAECLIKARFFEEGRTPLSLIETLRFDPKDGFVRKDLHLSRLARSASAFAFSFDDDAARCALDAAVRNATSPQRVRLQWNEDGSFSLEAVPFVPPDAATVWTYVISPNRVQSGDILARHKTNWRSLYDQERAAANAKGCNEVIYLNERGEVVEATTTNVFVRIGGRLLTPAGSCGPLEGCLRRALLDAGECSEATLSAADLEKGETYLGNSLRGLIRAAPFAG
ncbi:MAG TPA: aminodeoxychorismate synthase component I [Micropepsaceae bacterium]|nr:aminodeoxychorismate synthase component I [Micropepsaceae bacterium]